MQKLIVFITGLTGAGKTSIGVQLSKAQGIPFFSIGRFQRIYALKQGFKDVTEFNRKMGLEKAYFDLLPSILDEIKQKINQNKGLVIEGLYSKSVFDSVKKEFPHARIKLFNVVSSRHTRLNRIVIRQRLPKKKAAKILHALDKSKKMIGLQEVQQLSMREGIIVKNTSLNQAIKFMKHHIVR